MNVKRKYIGCTGDLERKKIKNNFSEQKFIDFNSVPSLETMALVNIAIALCGQSDIRDAMRKQSLEFDDHGRRIRGTNYNKSFNHIEKTILNKLSSLTLPDSIKASLSNIVRPIQFQIVEWISIDHRNIEFMDCLNWTSVGTIDRVKTLEQLIQKDSSQNTNSLFKLACKYCLEDSIPCLWEKLPEKVQNCYIFGKKVYTNYDSHLVAYWASVVNKKLAALYRKIKPHDKNDVYNFNLSIYINMFTLTLFEGNSIAAKYFWNKLSAEEIDCNLAQWVNVAGRRAACIDYVTENYQDSKEFADVLFFLLSKVDETEQQREIIQKNSFAILNSLFFFWPWQRFLLPTILTLYDSLNEKVYIELILLQIVPEIKEGKTTHKLLRELWGESSSNLKKCLVQHVIKQNYGEKILCKLLAVEDVKTIIEILKYTNLEGKKEVIFSAVKDYPFFKLIYECKLYLFNTLIEECLPLESDIMELKEEIVRNFGSRLCRYWLLDCNWQMMEKFMNWAFTSQKQIDNFTNNMDKTRITYSLLKRGNYEILNQFMNWCFCSEEEINQFKKEFAKLNLKLLEIGFEDWRLFEKFLAWCFMSEQEIDEFKLNVLQSCGTYEIIFPKIEFLYNFEFVDNLINWCCQSSDEIILYKEKLVLSKEWLDVLQRFVSNNEVDCSDLNNWGLIKKLINLFSPLHDGLKIKLKRRIEENIDFDDFRSDYNKRSHEVKKKHLFRILDDNTYDILVDNGSRIDSDRSDPDGD